MMYPNLVRIGLFFIGLIASAIQPLDYFTWTLEVIPALAGLAVLAWTYKNFKFTGLTYNFILLHCFILFIGGHYTYAEVPLFDWIRDAIGGTRNNYDKLGHFAQGFIPGMIAREVFVRQQIVKPGFWTGLLTVCVCLAVSVFYELGEWAVALSSGDASDAFLGTQGDQFDAQSDMFYCLIGALCMVFFMSGLQDKAIAKMQSEQA